MAVLTEGTSILAGMRRVEGGVLSASQTDRGDPLVAEVCRHRRSCVSGGERYGAHIGFLVGERRAVAERKLSDVKLRAGTRDGRGNDILDLDHERLARQNSPQCSSVHVVCGERRRSAAAVPEGGYFGSDARRIALSERNVMLPRIRGDEGFLDEAGQDLLPELAAGRGCRTLATWGGPTSRRKRPRPRKVVEAVVHITLERRALNPGVSHEGCWWD
jgi:hypothetical protein